MSACEKGNQWQAALELFSSMPRASLSPKLTTYAQLLDAVFDHEAAWAIYDKALQGGFIPKPAHAKG
eukprot:7268112-Alexandrium_andersonii.AAC.1